MKSLRSALQRRQIMENPVSIKELLQRYQADSMKALLIKMGPFVPKNDAFIFRNDFDLRATEFEQALGRIPTPVILELTHQTFIDELKKKLEAINIDPPFLDPISVWDALVFGGNLLTLISLEAFGKVAAELVEEVKDPLRNRAGFCGGMAFGGYDFYRQGWSVNRFHTLPPDGDELHEYIFQRLLDSLELNGATFVEWWAKEHILPRVNDWANQVVLASVGSVGGPIGIALGWWIGDKVHLFDLGGSESLLDITKDQWPIIKDRLDREAAWPIGIIFGNKFDLFEQHQILAINYTDNGNGITTLTVWDNNDARGWVVKDASGNIISQSNPDGSNTLTIDFRDDELQVSAISGSALSDDAIKGIFLQEYVPQQPPLSLGPI